MDYNTSRNKLILPEYGRNVQQLVEQAVTIEDEKEKKEFVQSIIDLMGRMYPYLRDLKDFKHKLWDHLLIMSDFKLNSISPYDAPKAEAYSQAPEKIPYSDKKIRFKHYGKTVKLMIQHAVEMDEGERKNILVGLIANHMKKLFLIWNRGIVADDQIFGDIKELSNDKLDIPAELILSDSKDLVSKKRRPRPKKR